MTLKILATTGMPNVIEAGKIMGELTGFTLLFFVMLFLVVVQLFALLWAFGKVAKSVEVVATVREAMNALSVAAIGAGSDAASNSGKLDSLGDALRRIEAEIGRFE